MKNIDEMSLEEALKQLEKTVAQMEDTSMSLEKSIEYFEKGVQLAKRARGLLDAYEQRITVLKKSGAQIAEVPMEVEDAELDG